jgi:hypothetical protein
MKLLHRILIAASGLLFACMLSLIITSVEDGNWMFVPLCVPAMFLNLITIWENKKMLESLED